MIAERRHCRASWILFLGLMVMAVGCRKPSVMGTAEYVKSIQERRQAIDKMLREERTSPIPAAARANFGGLVYYPVDPQMRMEVTAKPYHKEERVEMVTSKGELQQYIRYAYVDFAVGSQTARLTIYAAGADGRMRYFLPFKDQTSGKETYPAGRYMEVDIDRNWKTVLDFNKAYNPYCAYNHDYSCPIPPEENVLKIPIRAGERYVEPKS